MHFASLCVAFAVASSFSAARAAETHPFSIGDMLAMQRIGEPALSPDGKWLAFSLRTTDQI
jgi:hypothetical protein